MKVGLVADIHGNLAGLRAGLASMPEAEIVLLAGDALNSYRLDPEVLREIETREVRYILGNNERSLLRHTGPDRRRPADSEAWAMLERTPDRLRLELEGKSLLLVHGSPWPPEDEYLYPGNPRLRQVDELGVDYLVYGHTHVPHELRVGATLVVNPGSAGDARGWNGGLLSCAELDTETDAVRFVELADPRLADPAAAAVDPG